MKKASFAMAGGVTLSAGLTVLSAPNIIFPSLASWQAAVSYVAFAPLFWALQHCRTWKTGAIAGAAYGALVSLVGHYWILGIGHLEHRRWPLWILLSLGMALLRAAFGGAVVFIWQRTEDREQRTGDRGQGTEQKRQGLLFSVLWALCSASLWVTMEWIEHLSFGVTWHVGLSQHGWLPGLQLASVAGIAAVSFLCVFVNQAIVSGQRRMFALAAGLVLVTHGWGAFRVAFVEATGGTSGPTVAILQGGVPHAQTRDKTKVMETFAVYEELAKNLPPVKVVVWPEAATPPLLRYHPKAWPRMVELVKKSGSPHAVGVLDAAVDSRGEPTAYYNSAWLYGTDGRIAAEYRKRRLFPLGEKKPWKGLGWLDGLFVGQYEFTSGSALEAWTLPSEGEPRRGEPLRGDILGVLICNEIYYLEDLRWLRQQGAGLIANITNDGWFGRSAEPAQHVMTAIARAVESGAWILRASNSGISCVVSPVGRMEAFLPLDQKGTIIHRLSYEAVDTPYLRWGDAFRQACVVATAGALVFAGVKRFA